MVDDDKRCIGLNRQTGERCKNKPFPPSKYCRFHGAQNLDGKGGPGRAKGSPKVPGSGGRPPLGNANAMTHGANTPKVPAEMQTLRDSIFIRYTGDAKDISETDLMAFERVAGIEAKFRFALADEETPARALDTIHRTLHRELKALKATREMRETNSTGTSPAEVIAAIMIKVDKRRKELAERKRELEGHGRIEAPRPAQAMSAPARRAAVIDVDLGPAEDDGPDEWADDPEPDPPVVQTDEEEVPEPELLEDQATDCDDDDDDDDMGFPED